MKKLVSLMLVMALVLSMATVVNAVVETANLNVSVAKTAKIGDEVTVTVDWAEKMESVDLELGFDKTKVEFVSSSIAEDYIATDRIKDGVVQISWFTANGKGITNITYKFKVIANGTAKFTTAEAILADANVESPEEYKYGTATLTVKAEETPSTETEKPSTDTQTPSTETEKPSTDTQTPSTETQKPSTDTQTPSTETEKPSTDTQTPSTETEKPSTDTQTPSTETEKPSTDTQTPSTETQKPSTDTSKPSTDTSKKPTSIPQAGINMVQIAIVAIIVISAIVVVAYKSTKR